MSEIHVSVTDQVMKLTQSPILASGGVNETKVVFTFCEKWDGFVKTALFYRDTEKVYYAILENDTCILPWEVYAENGTFFFTVFGDKDTTRRTAGVLRYKVGKGIVADDATPSDPTPDVYDQIMALLAKNNDIAADLEEKRDSGYFNGEKGEKGDKGDKGDQGDPGTPGSALIDDSVASTENAWSSKNTVDKLCPTFTESGSVVTCEPVEGYPLEVEWQRKNLWKVDTNVINGGYMSPNGNTATIAYASGAYTVFVPCEPNTTYTVSKFAGKRFGFGYSVEVPDVGVTVYGYVGNGSGSATSLTTTTGADAKYLVAYVYFDGTDASIMSWNDAKHTVQIELGNTATAYEPYAETATITHCGKNLLPSEEYRVSSANGNHSSELSGNTLVINCDGTGTGNVGLNYKADRAFVVQPGTYTFSISHISGTISANNVEWYLGLYTGSAWAVVFPMYGTHGYQNKDARTVTFTEPTTVAFQSLSPASLGFTDCTFNLQLEFGDKQTAFEPSKGSATYAPNEPITAFDGTNVIYPDVGTVTVTGKANPSAIIEKLTNAILSLGGNV